MELFEDEFLSFDPGKVVAQMTQDGAAVVPLLPQTWLWRLREEMRTLPAPKTERAHQRYSLLEEVTLPHEYPIRKVFPTLHRMFSAHLTTTFRSGVWPFEGKLVFNELSAQRYSPSAMGLKPHQDFRPTRNLMVMLVVAGEGELCLCRGRLGAQLRPLPAAPGSAIFLPLPGFGTTDTRPWHVVRNLTEEWRVVVFRQVFRAEKVQR